MSQPDTPGTPLEAIGVLCDNLDAEQRRAARAIYCLLADGEPVTVQRVAKATDVDQEDAARLVEGLPRVEFDERGRVVSFGGLTLARTSHRLLVEGRPLYTWCAWDALFIPVVTDATGEITSVCPQTGAAIDLTVTPEGLADRSPSTVVMSFVVPDQKMLDDVRDQFCALVHFFVDETAAAQWASGRDEVLIVSLEEAFQMGRECLRRSC